MALSNNDAPFSLNDFQQLVSSAFDLHSDIPHRSASQGPVSLPSPRLEHPPTPMVSTTQVPLSSPDHDTNGHPPSLNTAATSNPRSPTSVSFVKPHRSFAPRSFISSLRSRASAILRPSNSPSAIIARSQSTTPTPSLSSTARPSLSSHRTHTPRPSQQALLHSISQTLSHPTPSSRPSSPFAFNPKDVKRAITRDRSRSLPKSFLDISRQDTPPPVPSLDDLYSFFDDSAYSMDAPVPPYARPPNPATSFPVLQVHTRLPPLRKSKSCAPALFKKQNRKQSSGAVESRSRNSSIQAIRAGIDKSDNYPFPPASRCPSPYTSPRPAPRPPTTGRLSVPGYLSDRRGSTTSTCTTSSTRTVSSIGERISQMFPFSFPRSLSKSRLHLSLASSNSTPSSTTSGSWSSPLTPASAVFPIAGDVRTGNPLYAAGTNASKASIADFAETVQEALAIGRVLTPDDDPFAKGDISLNSEETPRILGAPVEWNKDFTFSPGGFHPKFEGVSPCDPCFSATNMGPLSPFASEPPCSGYPISPTSTSFPIHQNNMVRKASIELSPYENYSSRSVSPEPFASHDRSLSPSPSPVPASAFPMPPPLPTFLSGTPLHLFKPLPRIPVDVLDYSDPLYRNSNDRRKSQSYLAKRDRSSLPTSLRGQPGLPERSASTGTQSKSSSPGSAKKRPQSPFPLIRGFEGSSVTPMLTRPVDQLGGAIPSSQGVGHNISSEAEVEMWPVVVKHPISHKERLRTRSGTITSDVVNTSIDGESDGHRSRSTAFFSARSSVLSLASGPDAEESGSPVCSPTEGCISPLSNQLY